MPISRIDLMTIAPKTQEAAQIKHVENQKSGNEQAQIQSQFNQAVQQNTSKTVKAAKSENKEFRYDAKEKGNSSYSKKKNKKKGKDIPEEEQKKENKDPFLGVGFDMKF